MLFAQQNISSLSTVGGATRTGVRLTALVPYGHPTGCLCGAVPCARENTGRPTGHGNTLHVDIPPDSLAKFAKKFLQTANAHRSDLANALSGGTTAAGRVEINTKITQLNLWRSFSPRKQLAVFLRGRKQNKLDFSRSPVGNTARAEDAARLNENGDLLVTDLGRPDDEGLWGSVLFEGASSAGGVAHAGAYRNDEDQGASDGDKNPTEEPWVLSAETRHMRVGIEVWWDTDK